MNENNVLLFESQMLSSEEMTNETKLYDEDDLSVLKRDWKPSSIRNFVLRVSATNYIKHDIPELDLKAGDVVEYDKEKIYSMLTEWSETKKFSYYFCEHNEDPENVHFHIVICFKDATPFEQVKSKFPIGHIAPCMYGVVNAVLYLLHRRHPLKHQYAPEDIVTNNPNKLEDYLLAKPKSIKVRLKETVEKILSGDIKEFEADKIDYDLYLKKAPELKRAFELKQKLLLMNPDRELTVIVLQGLGRLGKSFYCKQWAKEHNMSICFSSGSNDPWQDYGGQDVFVYDDFNFEKTKIQDLLKVLDPHNTSTVSARYKNRLFSGSIIFITTNTPFLSFYDNQPNKLRNALYDRVSCVLDFKKDSECEGVAYYTKNIVVENDVQESEPDLESIMFGEVPAVFRHCERKLQPIDDKVYKVDLNHYFDYKKTEPISFFDDLSLNDMVEA